MLIKTLQATGNIFLKYKLFYIPKKFLMDFDITKDYYKILGLTKSATDKEIKSAYYKMAKKYHPDLNGGKQSNEFKEMTNAYDILSDAIKKKDYDTFRSSQTQSGFGDSFWNRNNKNTNTNNGQTNYNSNNSYSQYDYNNYSNNNKQKGPFEGADNFEAFKDRFRSQKTRYEYKDPNTGEWKTYYEEKTGPKGNYQGNPFFRDFEDIFSKINQQKQKNQSYYYDEASRKNSQNDFFKNYYERNKDYNEHFRAKNEKNNEDHYNQFKNFNTQNPFEYTNSNGNTNNNNNPFEGGGGNYNYNFNYEQNSMLLYIFLRRVFIFMTIYMFFNFLLKRRMSYDYEFNNPHPHLSNYSSSNNPYISPFNNNNYNAHVNSNPINYNNGNNFGRLREKEYDPFDPSAKFTVKK
jgi:curved DNA-binding protein CbpA